MTLNICGNTALNIVVSMSKKRRKNYLSLILLKSNLIVNKKKIRFIIIVAYKISAITMSIKYVKTRSQNTSHGLDYQADWCMLYILRADDQLCEGLIKDYQIASENEAAGLFDDITITLIGKSGELRHIFEQLKHKSGRKQCFGKQDLQNDNDFKVKKYFASYQKIKEDTSFVDIKDVSQLILATNIDLHEDVIKDFSDVKLDPKDILCPVNDCAKYYKFKDDSKILEYLPNDVDHFDAENFRNKFMLAVNQLGGSEIRAAILQEFPGLKEEMLLKMLDILKDWLNNKKGFYIDNCFFESIRRRTADEELKKYDFRNDQYLSERGIFQGFAVDIKEFITDNNRKYTEIFYPIEHRSTYFCGLDLILKEKCMEAVYFCIKDFEADHEIYWLAKGKVFVYDCETTMQFSQKKRFENICKKIIVMLPQFELKDRRLTKQVIHLRRNFTGTSNIGVHQTKEDFDKCSKILSLLVENDGNYVFVKRFKGELSLLSDEKSDQTVYNPQLQCRKSCIVKNYMEQPLLIVSAEPGYGKSTFLKILEMKFRAAEKYINHDIIFLNASKYASMPEYKSEKEKIFLFDAFDEADKNEQIDILKLVKDSIDRTNVTNIYLTTRPHLKVFLETHLSQFSWSFDLLTVEDQKNIAYGLASDPAYVEQLMKDIHRSKLSEIFQNILIFRLFVSVLIIKERADIQDLKAFEGIAEIYTIIIEEFFNIWLKEKMCLDSSMAVHKYTSIYMRNDLICDMEDLALHVLFNVKYPSFKILTDTPISFGLITSQGTRTVNFIHRTIAEYFVARKIIADPSKLENHWIKKIFIPIRNNHLKKFDEWEFVRKCLTLHIKNKELVKRSELLHVLRDEVFVDVDNLEQLDYWQTHPELFLFVINCLSADQKISWKQNFKWTNLMLFAYQYNDELVEKELATNPADVTAVNLLGQEALSLVCCQGPQNIAKILLENGASINHRDANGSSPLAYATSAGHFKLVKFLVSKDADINIRDIAGRSLVFIAIITRNLNIAEYLIQSGHCNIDEPNNRGITPLMIACQEGFLEMAGLLLQNGANINNKDIFDGTALSRATYNKHLGIISLLINNGADVNTKQHGGISPLHIAAQGNFLEIAKFLILSENCNIESMTSGGFTPFLLAVDNDSIEVANFLIDYGVDVTKKSITGLTALAMASRYGRLEMVKLLIEKGADVNAKRNDGSTPLFFAAEEDKQEVVVELLKTGNCDINEEDHIGYTALMKAAEKGNAETVEILINFGANIKHRSEDGQTALRLAIIKGHDNIAKLLVDEDGSDTSEYNTTPLHVAAEENQIEVVKMLLNEGIYHIDVVDEHGNSPLISATREGHENMVKILVEHAANVNHENVFGQTSLIMAAFIGHIEIVKFLISKGADVNAKENEDGSTPLFSAAQVGCLEVVKELLATEKCKIDDVNDNGFSPLMIAAFYGHKEIAKLLIKYGADINRRCEKQRNEFEQFLFEAHIKNINYLQCKKNEIMPRDDGCTALFFASMRNHVNVIGILLKTEKCSIDDVNSCGITPLMIACIKGNIEIAKTLISYGGNADFKNKDGLTALLLASCFGYFEIVKLLISKNADVNVKTSDGTTPLQIAAKNGHTQTVDFLLKQGAYFNIKNESGQSALDLAILNNHSGVVNLLNSQRFRPKNCCIL